MMVGGGGGLLPSYNERVVYIYIERTFLDKKLSPSCGQGPRRITRGHFHYASSLPQPSWDGSGRANKAETPPSAERYFPYARAGKCVGSWSAIWTKGVVLGEFRKGERRRIRLFNSARVREKLGSSGPRVPFVDSIQGMIGCYSGCRFRCVRINC